MENIFKFGKYKGKPNNEVISKINIPTCMNSCSKCKNKYFSDNCCEIIDYKKNKDILIVHEENLSEYDLGNEECEYILLTCSNNLKNEIYILEKNPSCAISNKEIISSQMLSTKNLSKNQCSKCLKIFSDKYKLKTHYNKKTSWSCFKIKVQSITQ